MPFRVVLGEVLLGGRVRVGVGHYRGTIDFPYVAGYTSSTRGIPTVQ